MNSRNFYNRHLNFITTLLVFLSIFFACACGGGTTGTDGGRTSVVTGRITDTQGTPIPDITVTVLENGSSGHSNQNGEYNIETNISGDAIGLNIAGQNFDVTFESLDIANSSNKDLIFANIVIDVEAINATVVSLTINGVEVIVSNDTAPVPQAPDTVDENISEPKNTESRLNGNLISENQAPIEGAKVRIDQGKAVATNSDGSFKLNFKAGKSKITLNIEYQGQNASVTISDLPSSAVTISATIKLAKLPAASPGTGPNEPNSPIFALLESVEIKRR